MLWVCTSGWSGQQSYADARQRHVGRHRHSIAPCSNWPTSRLKSRASQEGTTVGSVATTSALFWLSRLATCATSSPSSLHQTHIPFTIRPAIKLGLVELDDDRMTGVVDPPRCACCRCVSSAQTSTMKFAQSTIVRGETPKCHATWCGGTSVVHEKRSQTSFP